MMKKINIWTVLLILSLTLFNVSSAAASPRPHRATRDRDSARLPGSTSGAQAISSPNSWLPDEGGPDDEQGEEIDADEGDLDESEEGEESEQGKVCHPVAQRIADLLNTLNLPTYDPEPEQIDEGPAEETAAEAADTSESAEGEEAEIDEPAEYTCEAIYDLFDGVTSGFQIGFGRIQHAIRLASDMGDVAWEALLDWHLDGNGWGTIVQLDTLSDVLEGWSFDALMGLLDGETTLKEMRTAARLVERYDADFETALEQVSEEGNSPGKVGQYYRLLEECGLEAATLDGYLVDGHSLKEVRKACRTAEREGRSLEEILAGATTEELQGQEEREQRQAEREAAQLQRRVEQMIRKHGVSEAEILAIYQGDCAQNWSCVNAHFRQQRRNGPNGHGNGNGKGKGPKDK